MASPPRTPPKTVVARRGPRGRKRKGKGRKGPKPKQSTSPMASNKGKGKGKGKRGAEEDDDGYEDIDADGDGDDEDEDDQLVPDTGSKRRKHGNGYVSVGGDTGYHGDGEGSTAGGKSVRGGQTMGKGKGKALNQDAPGEEEEKDESDVSMATGDEKENQAIEVVHPYRKLDLDPIFDEPQPRLPQNTLIRAGHSKPFFTPNDKPHHPYVAVDDVAGIGQVPVYGSRCVAHKKDFARMREMMERDAEIERLRIEREREREKKGQNEGKASGRGKRKGKGKSDAGPVDAGEGVSFVQLVLRQSIHLKGEAATTDHPSSSSPPTPTYRHDYARLFDMIDAGREKDLEVVQGHVGEDKGNWVYIPGMRPLAAKVQKKHKLSEEQIKNKEKEDKLKPEYDENVKIARSCHAAGQAEVGVEAELYGDAVLKRPGQEAWDAGEFVIILSPLHKCFDQYLDEGREKVEQGIITQEEYDQVFADLFLSGVDKVRRLHLGQYIHLDLKPQNFVVKKIINENTGESELTKELLLIDYRNAVKRGTPLRECTSLGGTKRFMPSAQLAFEVAEMLGEYVTMPGLESIQDQLQDIVSGIRNCQAITAEPELDLWAIGMILFEFAAPAAVDKFDMGARFDKFSSSLGKAKTITIKKIREEVRGFGRSYAAITEKEEYMQSIRRPELYGNVLKSLLLRSSVDGFAFYEQPDKTRELAAALAKLRTGVPTFDIPIETPKTPRGRYPNQRERTTLTMNNDAFPFYPEWIALMDGLVLLERREDGKNYDGHSKSVWTGEELEVHNPTEKLWKGFAVKGIRIYCDAAVCNGICETDDEDEGVEGEGAGGGEEGAEGLVVPFSRVSWAAFRADHLAAKAEEKERCGYFLRDTEEREVPFALVNRL